MKTKYLLILLTILSSCTPISASLFTINYKPIQSAETHEVKIDSKKNGQNQSKDERLAIAFTNIGDNLSENKQYKEAIQQYQLALIYNPDYTRAYNNWGDTLINMGNMQEGIEKCSIAIEKNPTNPLYYFTVAEAYGKMTNPDYQQVSHYLEKALEIIDKNPGLHTQYKDLVSQAKEIMASLKMINQ